MKQKKPYKIYSLQQLYDYILNRMKGVDRYTLEKEMQNDPFMEDALEGLSMVEEKKAKADVFQIHKKIRSAGQTSHRNLIMGIAAGLAILIIAGLGYLAVDRVQKSSRQTQVTHDHQPPQPMGDMDPIIQEETDNQKKSMAAEEIGRETTARPAAVPDATVPQLKKEVKSTPHPEEMVTETLPSVSDPAESPLAGQQPMAARLRETSAIRNPAPSMMLLDRAETHTGAVSGRIIEGRIIDGEDGLPLPGVSVVIKGTPKGTITDPEGKFQLEIPFDNDIRLQAMFIGMTTIEFSPGELTGEALTMHPDMLALSEIVVIGYGSRSAQAPALHESTLANTPAEPVDGYRMFNQYIKENAVLPSTSAKSRATVILRFEINRAGEPVNLEVLRSPGEELSQQAIELIKNGPHWIPATSAGQYHNEPVRLRIVFRKK